METYNQFLNRINSFELPYTYYGEGYIQMNPNLSGKVEEDNRFKLFYGDNNPHTPSCMCMHHTFSFNFFK